MNRCVFLLSALLAALCAQAAEIQPGDARLRHICRFTNDHRCAWTGSAVEFRTDAVRCTLSIEEKGHNFLAVYVDGKEHAVIELQKDKTDYPVEDLPTGEKRVAIIKRTEALLGEVRFLGIDLPDGANLLAPPPAPDRKIAVVGDSISCGYGNESASVNDGFQAHQEDGTTTYWAIAARELGADAVCTAWSGRGIYRNRKSEPGVNTMPVLYERTLPSDPESTWDFSRYTPDVVVINLGTNDSARGIPEHDAFIAAYKGFIERVRQHAPNALVFCCNGPMVQNEKKEALAGMINDMIAQLDDGKTFYVDLGEMERPGELGGHYHPNEKCHKRLAGILKAAIAEKTGWE